MFFGFCLEETIWSECDGFGFGMNETGAAMGLDEESSDRVGFSMVDRPSRG